MARLWADGVDSTVVFGLPLGSAPDVVRRRYRTLSLKCHPDKGGCVADFQILGRALETMLQAAQELLEVSGADMTEENAAEDCSDIDDVWDASGMATVFVDDTAKAEGSTADADMEANGNSTPTQEGSPLRSQEPLGSAAVGKDSLGSAVAGQEWSPTACEDSLDELWRVCGMHEVFSKEN